MANDTQFIKEIVLSREKRTNSFKFYDEIFRWIDEGKADFYLTDGNVFVFYKADGFYKFYYYVDKLADIKLAKNLLDSYAKSGKISLEFTTKNNLFLDELGSAAQAVGFEFYAEYARVNSGINKLSTDDPIEGYRAATHGDADELYHIMNREFDKLKDDIPDKDELASLIDSNSVLIKKVDGEIIYIQIFEYSINRLYSRMTWIDKKYRKPKYTIEYFNANNKFIKELGVRDENKRSYCWVDTSNKNFKIILKTDGKLDGLTNNIFIYKAKFL